MVSEYGAANSVSLLPKSTETSGVERAPTAFAGSALLMARSTRSSCTVCAWIGSPAVASVTHALPTSSTMPKSVLVTSVSGIEPTAAASASDIFGLLLWSPTDVFSAAWQ